MSKTTEQNETTQQQFPHERVVMQLSLPIVDRVSVHTECSYEHHMKMYYHDKDAALVGVRRRLFLYRTCKKPEHPVAISRIKSLVEIEKRLLEGA